MRMAAAPPGPLAEYGAIGVVLVFAGFAIRVLYQHEVRAYERERERADRLETEVRALNETLRDFVSRVHATTEAPGETTARGHR